jgi:dipeptidase E
MHTFVAIGGGEIRNRETERIDRYALELTGVEQPKVLFIPTASGDAQEYSEDFVNYYSSLGADVDVLKLTKNPSSDVVEDAILSADMIYCGGGNTKFAVEQWKEFEIPALLEQTKQQKRMQVLGGISAGANIWFEFYVPIPSRKYPISSNVPPRIGTGLGLIPNMVVSTHHASERKAQDKFLEEVLPLPNRDQQVTANAYAIDDHAAAIFEPGIRAYAITSRENVGVQLIHPMRGEMPHRRSGVTNGRPPSAART